MDEEKPKKIVCLTGDEYAVLKGAIERAETEEDKITTTSPAEFTGDSSEGADSTTVKKAEDAPEEGKEETDSEDQEEETPPE